MRLETRLCRDLDVRYKVRTLLWGNRELLINRHKISGKKDEYILDYLLYSVVSVVTNDVPLIYCNKMTTEIES